MSPRAVGGRSLSVWGCCWKPQATAAVRMALSRSVEWVGCAGRGLWPCDIGTRPVCRAVGGSSGGVVCPGPHPLGGWGEGWGWSGGCAGGYGLGVPAEGVHIGPSPG